MALRFAALLGAVAVAVQLTTVVPLDDPLQAPAADVREASASTAAPENVSMLAAAETRTSLPAVEPEGPFPGTPVPDGQRERFRYEVLVVDQAGTPVANAEVWCARARVQPAPSEGIRSPNHSAPIFHVDFSAPRRHATRTNAHGRAELSVHDDVRVCYARTAGGEGALPLVPGVTLCAETLVIPLHEARRAAVQTIARNGRPVGGVPLVLRAPTGVAGDRSPRPPAYLGCTDPQGRLEIQDLDRQVARLGSTRLEVAVDLLEAGPGTELDLATCTAELRVLVPESGPLTIRVFDGIGRRVSEARVVLANASEANPETVGARPHETGRTNEAGVVVFPHVTTGRRFDLVVETEGQRESQTISGPPFDGVAAEFVVVLRDPPVEIVGRAVDELDEALAEHHLRFTASGSTWVQRIVHTDDRGEFRMTLPRELAGSSVGGCLELLGDSATRAAHRSARIAAVWVVAGENRVGTVRIRSTPLVVAGRIDGAGEPDTRAWQLTVEERFVAAESGEFRWRPIEGLATHYPSLDSFEVRGWTDARELRLAASPRRSGHPAALPVEFSPAQHIVVSSRAPAAPGENDDPPPLRSQ